MSIAKPPVRLAAFALLLIIHIILIILRIFEGCFSAWLSHFLKGLAVLNVAFAVLNVAFAVLNVAFAVLNVAYLSIAKPPVRLAAFALL